MKKLLASVALAALIAAPASAQDADTVLATVNGKDITLGHLIATTQSLPSEFQELPDEQLFSGLLEQMVRQEAMAATVRDNPSRATQLLLETQEMAVLANTVIDEATAISEDELRAIYEEEAANFEPEPEFNASHILVQTEEEASSLVAQLADGADFAELASTFSTGPSGPNGGQLGWFGVGQMVPSFEAAVRELEPGAVSAPVETQFGWHVITLNETRTAPLPGFEDMRGRLLERIGAERAQAAVAAATAAATITRTETEIDPSLIRNTDLIAD